MNHNFLGQPTREDTQTLEQLRRQLMPMIGLLDKLQADVMVKMNRGETVSWPHIRHTISILNSYLASINAYINGSYRHTSEEVKNTEGKPVLDEEKNPVSIYRDYPNEGHADRIAALHPFPMAPFPMMNERLAAMASVLLDKRLGPTEEKWVEERLRKAAEFAYVPSEWGIEPKKAEPKDTEESDDEDDMKGWDDGIPTKRVKGTLNEDELMKLWSVGHRTAFDKKYAQQMRFGVDDGDAEMGGEEEEDEEEGEEEEEEDDFEDAMNTPAAQPAPPVQMIRREKPAVHQPVAGMPVMSLGVVHRFMTSGDIGGRTS